MPRADATTIRAGIDGLVVLKTSKSAFDNFLRDPYTTLKEDRNRILSTSIHADWLYEGSDIEFGPLWHGIRQTLLETFAEHDSKSLQHTLYAMGEAVLIIFDRVREIRFRYLISISFWWIFPRLGWTIRRKFFCRPMNRMD